MMNDEIETLRGERDVIAARADELGELREDLGRDIARSQKNTRVAIVLGGYVLEARGRDRRPWLYHKSGGAHDRLDHRCHPGNRLVPDYLGDVRIAVDLLREHDPGATWSLSSAGDGWVCAQVTFSDTEAWVADTTNEGEGYGVPIIRALIDNLLAKAAREAEEATSRLRARTDAEAAAEA